jgi:hypothetical protein
LRLVFAEYEQSVVEVVAPPSTVWKKTLPDYEHAVIPEEKLWGYALNTEHETGQHKAKVFARVLGIERQHWTYLHDEIIEGLPESEAVLHHEAVRETVHWRHWTVPILVAGRNSRQAFVTTGWATRQDREPRLTTIYVERSIRNRELCAT